MALYLISSQQRTCDSSCVMSSEIAECFAVGFANGALSYHSAGLRETRGESVWVSAVAHSPQVDATSALAKPFCGSTGTACVQPAVLRRRLFTLLIWLK